MEPHGDALLLSEVDLELAAMTARESIRWTWETFGHRSCVLTSLQDAVLVDLAQSVAPDLPIVFLDNGYQFDSTLETKARIEERYGITIQVVRPVAMTIPMLVEANCCSLKVPLLERALHERDAWISGIQRVSTEKRRSAQVVDIDRRGKTKVSPLVQWNDADRGAYIEAFDVITHPLLAEGYSSIGCEPCTSPSPDGGRSGRTVGIHGSTECGLHL